VDGRLTLDGLDRLISFPVRRLGGAPSPDASACLERAAPIDYALPAPYFGISADWACGARQLGPADVKDSERGFSLALLLWLGG
jgi:hypothetical protein